MMSFQDLFPFIFASFLAVFPKACYLYSVNVIIAVLLQYVLDVRICDCAFSYTFQVLFDSLFTHKVTVYFFVNIEDVIYYWRCLSSNITLFINYVLKRHFFFARSFLDNKDI